MLFCLTHLQMCVKHFVLGTCTLPWVICLWIFFTGLRKVLSNQCFTLHTVVFIYFLFFMQVARHTRPEGHFKVWATIIFSRGRCHLLLGLKQGYPSLVEQKALTCTSPILRSKCHDRDSNPHLIKHWNTRAWIRCIKPLGHDTQG